ncbi:DUF1145 domain-containing protein [Metapseudomonas boanensis]|uniref:DUF1145 domain-containing protein n=1 Tax=Metapseudomonas boanensis TaxID=2822138 RepID=A0ABS5XE87_9GAMM|nr:DUF1145 domain-containing protein [Pseudomonas boanensis]MBT8764627.1 DUF1145 domain-containing protein [Pseudomonas boanensis]
MRVFLGLGKVVALLFWLAVIANLFVPFAAPFDVLLNGAGALLLLVHLGEALLFNPLLQRQARPWLDRLQLLLFGVFHLLGLSRRAAQEEHSHA